MYQTVYPGNPATINDLMPRMEAGSVFTCEDNTVWKYVKFHPEATNTLLETHMIVYWENVAHTEVTGVMAEALSNHAAQVAGVYQGPNILAVDTCYLLANRYICIQVGGFGLIHGDGGDNEAVGQALIAITGGVVDHVAVSTAAVYAIAGWVVQTPATTGIASIIGADIGLPTY